MQLFLFTSFVNCLTKNIQESDSIYLYKKSIDNIHETCDKDFFI